MTEKDVMNWLLKNKPHVYYMNIACDNFLEKRNIRELGKLFSEVNEYVQKDWIHKNTNLIVVRNDDYNNSIIGFDYDLITSDGLLKIQSKIRYNRLHIEQTRRPTRTNTLNNRSSSGYVRYAVGESDVFLFSKPKSIENYLDINSWDIVAIPEYELIDSNNPKFLRVSAPKKIYEKYLGKTKEVLEQTYLSKKISIKNIEKGKL
jgi:hypothetical protein